MEQFSKKPLIIYKGIRFAFETVFVSEQIAETRFRALVEICDKFMTKLNVFSYMILATFSIFKAVWKNSAAYCMTLESNSHFPKKIVICLIEKPLKMMKNAFYFTLKALPVLNISKFLI